MWEDDQEKLDNKFSFVKNVHDDSTSAGRSTVGTAPFGFPFDQGRNINPDARFRILGHLTVGNCEAISRRPITGHTIHLEKLEGSIHALARGVFAPSGGISSIERSISRCI